MVKFEILFKNLVNQGFKINGLMTDNNYQSPIDDLKDKVTDVSNEVKWSIGCYIPAFNVIFCLLAAVRMVNSDFCLFHVRQGLVIFGLSFFGMFVSTIGHFIGLGFLPLMFSGVVFLAYIAGIVTVIRKSTAPLPIVGAIAEKIPKYFFFELLTGKKADTIMNQSENKVDGAEPPTENKPAEPATPVPPVNNK